MTDIDIHFGWNAYSTCAVQACKDASITENAVMSWNDANLMISIFFYVTVQTYLNLAVISQAIQRDAELYVNIPQFKTNFTVQFLANNLNPVNIGGLNITTPGYVRVDFYGSPSLINKKSGRFPALQFLRLQGVDKSKVNFVETTYSRSWGRRGPSVHLWYKVNRDIGDVQTFYNEVTVPQGYDNIGTYAMAIGFSHGYFGMQVNSAKERRFLFSVWSPQETDDPKTVLQENKVILVEKGQNVTINDFSGEGTGGQSYLVYPWVADVAYKFKVVGYPSSDGYSVYSAYFQDPTKSSEYMLIATWKRPKTQTFLNGLYSFLENFAESKSHFPQKAQYNNQVAVNKYGKSFSIQSASYSYTDNDYNNRQRIDRDGGVDSKGFYLMHCGFFEGHNLKKILYRG